ncbi:hypothetical protein X801_08600, partial [Opisthorchis viverrini]
MKRLERACMIFSAYSFLLGLNEKRVLPDIKKAHTEVEDDQAKMEILVSDLHGARLDELIAKLIALRTLQKEEVETLQEEEMQPPGKQFAELGVQTDFIEPNRKARESEKVTRIGNGEYSEAEHLQNARLRAHKAPIQIMHDQTDERWGMKRTREVCEQTSFIKPRKQKSQVLQKEAVPVELSEPEEKLNKQKELTVITVKEQPQTEQPLNEIMDFQKTDSVQHKCVTKTTMIFQPLVYGTAKQDAIGRKTQEEEVKLHEEMSFLFREQTLPLQNIKVAWETSADQQQEKPQYIQKTRESVKEYTTYEAEEEQRHTPREKQPQKSEADHELKTQSEEKSQESA